MTHYLITRTLFAASLLIAAGTTHAQIARCITAAGVTTFTNAPCKNDEDTVRIIGVSRTSPAAMRVEPAIKGFAEAERTRAARAAMLNPHSRSLQGDVAMMKIAHAMLAANDEPSRLARKQALSDSAEVRAASYWAWLVPLSAFSDKTQ